MAAPQDNKITSVKDGGQYAPPGQAVPTSQQIDRTTNANIRSDSRKPCTFQIHTMEHQAAMSIKPNPCTVEVYSTPSEITVDEIMKEVLKELNFTNRREAERCFSIWLTSPQLQLQLKGTHHPCLLYKQWQELLVLYTDCGFDTIKTDKPILSFQRNAFLKMEDERKITDSRITELLYEEAKLNVLRGMYPIEKEKNIIDMEKIRRLAGIQAEIEDTFNAAKHTDLYYKYHVVNYFPYHMVKRTRGIILPVLMPPFVPRLEVTLVEAHREASSSNNDKLSLKEEYLDICRSMSHYGSALFKGQIEKRMPLVPKFLGSLDHSISVAINTYGVHIIKGVTPPETVLFLPFCEMSWKYKECNDNGEDFFSALILEYDDSEKVHQLKIFSRQAPMMENMIERITADLNYCEHKKKELGGDDEVDFAGQLAFTRKIHVVDHMLVSEVVPPNRTSATSKPAKLKNGNSGGAGNDNFETRL